MFDVVWLRMLNLLVIVAAEIVGTLVASAPRTEDFSITQPGRTLTARVDASGLSGPMLQLGRAPGELRGRIRNFPTELRFSADRVSGLVGRAPVDLHITRSDEGLRVQGLFAGKLSNLRINSAELKAPWGNAATRCTSRKPATRASGAAAACRCRSRCASRSG